MPRGIHMLGRKFSEETKRKISVAHKGNQYCLGKKASMETRLKMSLSHKGKNTIGHPRTEETRLKIKENNSRFWLGKKKKPPSVETRLKMSEAHIKRREKNHFWKGGITPVNTKLRNSLRNRILRDSCFQRDDYTCQECNKRGGKLNMHHIKSFSKYPEFRFLLDNVITLCIDCHKKTDTYLKSYKNRS